MTLSGTTLHEDLGGDGLFANLAELAPVEGRTRVGFWPGLTIHRSCAPGHLRRTVFDALSVVVIAQGAGAVTSVGDQRITRDSSYVIIAADSTVDIRVIAASVRHPVFHCALRIDPELIRSISSRMYALHVAGRHEHLSGAADVSPLDDQLVHTVAAFLAALSGGCDRRVLAPLRMSELVYRLLQRDQRTRLLQLATDEVLCNPINTAVRHVSDHLAEPLSVDALAARAHMSPSAFSRAFREATGRPPYQYIKDCRLDRARELLEDCTLGVSAVAGAVGYRSVSHFIKEFHRRYGRTPGQYAENSHPLVVHSASRALT